MLQKYTNFHVHKFHKGNKCLVPALFLDTLQDLTVTETGMQGNVNKNGSMSQKRNVEILCFDDFHVSGQVS